jgi:hypothetical protein
MIEPLLQYAISLAIVEKLYFSFVLAFVMRMTACITSFQLGKSHNYTALLAHWSLSVHGVLDYYKKMGEYQR